MLSDAPVVAMLPCVDLEGAREFYLGTLGLREVEMPGVGEEEAEGMLFLQCGQGTYLGVYQRETPTRADHTAVGWMVQDLDAVVDGLLERGVTMETYDMPGVAFDERGIATMGNFRGVWFKDPEGNILSVNEMP